MNEELMRKVAHDLVSLSKGSGTTVHGDRKVQIPRSPHDEIMDFISKWRFEKRGSFQGDDPSVVQKAKELVQTSGKVLVVQNTATIGYDLNGS